MKQSAYDRLAPFIQEYIYLNKWNEMREIQVAACEAIFDKDTNLLLASGTASGKTEAAFLPALTELYNNPSESVGILYISPLKALINDQFVRLEDLLEYSGIPLCKWHGDANQSKKKKLLKNPQGVMQTTPESLEAMLIGNKENISALFSDLRFIIIDEVHYFMNCLRGVQLLCILERIKRISGSNPRRIGLSATLGDYTWAENWLNSGTGRMCVTPKTAVKSKSMVLWISSFNQAHMEEYINYIYNATCGKKCILFCNSRAAVEKNISELRDMNTKKHGCGKYLIHHGNISASLREYAEQQMKTSDEPITTGATTTLELGIDVGNLDRIVQTGAPLSASSFIQRLGRSGRRGGRSEMFFVLRDDPKEINWELLKTIAIIQLYIEERWIESIKENKYPFTVLYHQTMSVLLSDGDMLPKELAQKILTLSPFKNVSQGDYKELLQYLIKIGHIEVVDGGKLIIGTQAERIVNNYDFYSVFSTPIEYSVRHKNEEIGVIYKKRDKGAIFILAGRKWRVVDADYDSFNIYVEPIKSFAKPTEYPPQKDSIDTKIIRKIKDILSSESQYPYLDKKSQSILDRCRFEARNTGILTNEMLKGEIGFTYYPWLGTKALSALACGLNMQGINCSAWLYHGKFPLRIEFSNECDTSEIKAAIEKVKHNDIDASSIDFGETEIGEKFEKFLPGNLLKKRFVERNIDFEDMRLNL